MQLFQPKMPTIPETPKAPTVDDTRQAEDELTRLRRRRGRASTFLTGSQGDAMPMTATKRLTGQ